MTERSYDLEPAETKDSLGGVTACYDVLSVEPKGRVKTVCVSRLPNDGYYLWVSFQDGTGEWSISMPQGQWGPALKTLWDKLAEFDCPYFEIAEPQRRF
jgi:hypothetical protein